MAIVALDCCKMPKNAVVAWRLKIAYNSLKFIVKMVKEH